MFKAVILVIVKFCIEKKKIFIFKNFRFVVEKVATGKENNR